MARSNKKRKSIKKTKSVKKKIGLGDKISRLMFKFMGKKNAHHKMTFTADQYIIKGAICEGTFGLIMNAVNKNTNLNVAAKLEAMDTDCPQLQAEYEFYEMLGSDKPGFVKVFYYGPCDRVFNALIMELLGPDLDELFVSCNSIFSYKTTLMVAIQTVLLLKHVHSKRIIFRDIKPENFCIGHRFGNKEHLVHIIDFGLAKIQSGKRGGATDMAEFQLGYLVGTARYMSLNSHFGIDQSERDDMESLGYMFIYFLKGKLPWSGLSGIEYLRDHFQKIADLKKKLEPTDLIPGYPEFIEYMQYCKKMRHRQKPDYEYLVKIFRSAMEREKFEMDYNYDWSKMMRQRFLHEAISIDPDD